MSYWPHDDFNSKVAFYGDFFQKPWATLNLTRIKAPFDMYYAGKVLPRGIMCHEKIADALVHIFADIWDGCGRDQRAVDKSGASDYGGCFNIRKVAGSNNYSNHSWGAAIDLSPSKNGFRFDKSTTLDRVVIAAFKRQGALWGGDYHGRKDPMHFEFVNRG